MSADPPVLLVTQMFPPAVGGSGILLENIYSRVNVPVNVLTDRATCTGTEDVRGSLRLHRTRLDGRLWGVLDGPSIRQHLRVAGTIRQLGEGAVVHCGRAQPEGVAALAASFLPGGRQFLFWAHGEEITMAQASREFAWVMRRVYAGASVAIANSWNTASLLQTAGMTPSRIEVVYPGVDVGRFNPDVDASELRARFAPVGELLIVTVGRLQLRKGHTLALRALGRLRGHLPPFRYVIVGNGAEHSRLVALAAECGVADVVSFVGEVSDRDLPAYFAAADIFLHPNFVVDRHDFEGFGLVFLEAAAAGKAVIGGKTGGVSEAVEDGVTGILVSGTDEEELALAIERLARSAEYRHRLGAAGRERVEKKFTWDAAARAVERIHRRVADESDGRRLVPSGAHGSRI